jgi:DHA1 family multidrug resistance protein-like MFS transporter
MSTIANNSTLTPRERQLGLRALLVYTFFMVAGYSMLMPLVAVHFVNNVGMTTALVGIALAVRQITQQGLTVAGGLLCDKFGAKPMICAGVLVRAFGFASLAWAHDPTWLFFAMVLSALGGALFEAPYQATIVALTQEDNRQHYYLVSNWISGVATTIGPLIGIALLQFDFATVCFSAAGCFLLNSFIAMFLLPNLSTASEPGSSLSKLSLVLSNRRFVFFTALMMGYWFTSVQFNLSFALWAQKLSGHQESVGVMYAISAAITVTLQYHLVKHFEHKLDTRQILVLGLVVMSLSSGAIGFIDSYISFMVCVVFFSLGALLTRPTQQALTAALADNKALGSFMGFSYLGLAIGGGLGNWLGGWLIDIATNDPTFNALPWTVYCVVGLISAFGLYQLGQPLSEAKAKAASEAQTAAEPELVPVRK